MVVAYKDTVFIHPLGFGKFTVYLVVKILNGSGLREVAGHDRPMVYAVSVEMRLDLGDVFSE